MDTEAGRAAFESIDDPVALVDLHPVAVASLWRNVFDSIDCRTSDRVTVVHPSWWSPSRVDVVAAATQTRAGVAELRPRSWLFRQAWPAASIVEITDDLVVVIGDQAHRRDGGDVAEAVASSILSDSVGTTVIDAPAAVDGSRTLATEIAARLSGTDASTVVIVDDIRFRRLAAELKSSYQPPRATARLSRWVPVPAVLAACAVIGVGALHRPAASRAPDRNPTTIIVEGAVALEVPATWSTRRVIAGPGSARVQITSPTDSEVALHVTQSRVALPGLEATAEFLKTAIDAAPAGVFVDFNPVDHRAGRPVVSYREIRAGHAIRWIVWVDKTTRISIGCQSRGRDDTVSAECELAVRSARVLD